VVGKDLGDGLPDSHGSPGHHRNFVSNFHYALLVWPRTTCCQALA
jgi:hypothetical protein